MDTWTQQALKNKRTSEKGVITRMINTIPQVLHDNVEGAIFTLKVNIETKLQLVHDINELIVSKEADTTKHEDMLWQQVTYEIKVQQSVLELDRALKAFQPLPAPPPVQQVQPPVPPVLGGITNIKLPKLDIRKFDGDFTEWNSFWEVFEISVHLNTDLRPIQKFSYLKNLLLEEPLELISGFKLLADNYTQAVDLLKSTYGKKGEIKLSLVRKLLDAEEPKNNAESLLRFRSQFECIIRSLDTENLTLEELYTILLYNKLPSNISETIKRKCGDDWLEFGDFKKQLEEEIYNLRAFPAKPIERSSTVSTFNVEEDNSASFVQSVRPKEYKFKPKEISKRKCALCEGSHLWVYCKIFSTREKKVEKLRAMELCFVCASPRHFGRDCNKQSCKMGCTLKHHPSICPRNKKEDTRKKGSEVNVTTLSLTGKSQEQATRKSILPTATITLKGKSGRIEHKRGLLDPCAERTFVKRNILKDLAYKAIGKERMSLKGYLATKPIEEYEIVQLGIPHKGKLIHLNCVVVEELPEYIKRFDVKKTLRPLCKRKINLADKDFDLPLEKQSSIELLVGIDNVYNILHPGYKRVQDLILWPTIFGYVLTGSCKTPAAQDVQVTVLKLSSEEEMIQVEPEKDLKSLWELDHIGIKEEILTEQEKEVLENFEDTITYSKLDRQYVVALPWKGNKERLTTNFNLALGRLKQQCKKFQENADYLKNYQKVLQDQESRRFIEKVEHWNTKEHCHFLSHHGVEKDSRTTPIRVVYDCSARHGKHGLSLNDCLWTGPHITADLLKVLLQLRTNSYACTSDIEKAFLMVQLRKEDRKFTRFLWLENPLDPNSRIIVYQFRVVLFGATCSPFLLNATIKKHLSMVKDETEHIHKGLYVDNLLFTANDSEEMMNYFYQVNKIFSEAHLYLKEWLTNNSDLQMLVDTYGIGCEEKTVHKVLGLNWNKETDLLSVRPVVNVDMNLTKRAVLKTVAQVFDPLGLLLPVTVQGRMFLQELWNLKVGWDEQLPENEGKKWVNLRGQILKCNEISFPRSVSKGKGDQLHLFCDASTLAYGCAVYRVSNGRSNLLIAKAKVAPIKKVTIPRLELMALLLAARLLKFINEVYGLEKFCQTVVWSDSKAALGWLVSKHAQTVFVRNRVQEINSVIPQEVLSYVNTEENPSDYLTRGKTPDEIMDDSFWWEGPSWLKDSSWSKDRSWIGQPQVQDVDEGVVVNVVDVESKNEIIMWNRYSFTRKFARTLGWILRFVKNARDHRNPEVARQKVEIDSEEFEELTLLEEEEATRKTIILLQKDYFPGEYKALERNEKKPKLALIQQLNLYLDNGVIRCKGRLEHAQLPAQTRFPILLPKHCEYTRHLVIKKHKSVAHMGVNATVAEMRQEYWVPQLRQLVKGVIRQCVICKIVQGKSYMANVVPPLPEFRLQCKTPFSVTGVDYTGALWVKGLNKVPEKAYVLLFTCPVTRAVHIELVNNQSCNSFLLAFRKFCSRRTYPSLMLSDNATTFVAAAEHLKMLFEDPKVQQHLHDVKCEWKFIPARAPWFGAIWERLIGLVKTCLKKVVGQALLNFEELSCVLAEIESIVNDRPLTYVPGELNQLEVLTPNHLVYGRKLRTFPKEIVNWDDIENDPDYKQNLVEKRYSYVSQVCDDLWKRWRREYLTALRETHNVGQQHTQWPSEGEVVLIQDEGPRSKWKLGQVVKLHLGEDRIPRVATIRTSQSQLTRPIVKLYPLELKQELESVPPPQEIETQNEEPGRRPTRRTAQVAAEARRALINTGLL